MDVSLLDIKGVGPVTVRLLAEAGFGSVESVALADPKALAEIQGIGPVRAALLRTGARQLTADSQPVSAAPTSGDPSRRTRQAEKLRKQAKQLRKQARQLTKKAKSTKSKKKRKRRLREAAQLEAKAKRSRRKAKQLLTS